MRGAAGLRSVIGERKGHHHVKNMFRRDGGYGLPSRRDNPQLVDCLHYDPGVQCKRETHRNNKSLTGRQEPEPH